jgi:hypothetical protein
MTVREPAKGTQRRWRPSLAVKLAAAFAAAFAAGLAVALTVAAAALTGPADELAAIRLQDAARSAAAILQTGLTQRRREVEVLASIFPVDKLEPLDPGALRLFLRRVQELSPYYALIGFVDPSGRLLVSSNGLAEGADVSGREYFRRGRASAFISDAHPAILLAKAMGGLDAAARLIDVSTPITAGGRTLGVLCAHVSTEWAQATATTTARQLGLASIRLEVRDGSGDDIAVVGGGEEASARTETVADIGDGGTAGWTVVASLPASAAARLTLARAWPWALAAGGGIALAAGLGWTMGRRMSRSLETHTLAVVRLPGGALPEMRDEPTPELNDLGAAIRMAAEELAYFGGERISEAAPSRFSKNASG